MLIIYIISGCHNCERIHQVLENYDDKIIFNCDEMLRLNKDEFRKSMFNKTGNEKINFPICFNNDIYIGGVNELIYFLTFKGDWVEIYNNCES